jgi:hypothetical protein
LAAGRDVCARAFGLLLVLCALAFTPAAARARGLGCGGSFPVPGAAGGGEPRCSLLDLGGGVPSRQGGLVGRHHHAGYAVAGSPAAAARPVVAVVVVAHHDACAWSRDKRDGQPCKDRVGLHDVLGGLSRVDQLDLAWFGHDFLAFRSSRCPLNRWQRGQKERRCVGARVEDWYDTVPRRWCALGGPWGGVALPGSGAPTPPRPTVRHDAPPYPRAAAWRSRRHRDGDWDHAPLLGSGCDLMGPASPHWDRHSPRSSVAAHPTRRSPGPMAVPMSDGDDDGGRGAGRQGESGGEGPGGTGGTGQHDERMLAMNTEDGGGGAH